MEKQQTIETLVALGTLFLIFIVILVVAFILIHKRRLFIKESLITLLENECKLEISELKKELESQKKKIKTLQSAMGLNVNNEKSEET